MIDVKVQKMEYMFKRFTEMHLPFLPVAWTAPRQTRSGFMYSIHRKDKVKIQAYLRKIYRKAPINCGLELHAKFYYPLPKSYSKKKKAALLKQKYKLTVPDGSNLFKFIEDCGTGIMWVDDRLVVKHSAEKYWAETGGIFLKFRPLKSVVI